MHAHELAEQVAALVLLGVALYVLPASWLARRKARQQPGADRQAMAALDRNTIEFAVTALATTLALGAAVIHLALTPGYLQESRLLGLAIAAVAVVHIAIGGLALSGHLFRARAPALLVTAGLVGAWILSRAMGLPLETGAWERGLAEGTAISFEVGLLAVLLLARPARLRRTSGSRVTEATSVAVIPAVGILSTVALLVAVSVGAGSSGGHEHSAAPDHALEPVPDVFPTE